MSAAQLGAATIFKADNQDTLNTASSWVGGVLPTTSDVITWDNRVSAGNAGFTFMGGSFGVYGVQILDPQGPVLVLADGNLTLGAGGIDMSSASQDLTLNAPLVVGAGKQYWNVAAGRLLTLETAPTKGTGTAFNLQFSNTGTIKFGTAASALLTDAQSNAYATYGANDWAALDASGNVIAASYTAATTAITTGVINDIQGNIGSVTNTSLVSALRFNSATAYNLDIANSSTNRTMTVGGILVTANSGGGSIGGNGRTNSFIRPNRASGSGPYTFNVIQNSASDFTVGAIISNGSSSTATLVKSGSGKLILTGANGYSAGTVVSEGTLQVGNGGTVGALGSGNVTNHGSLIFNRSDAVTASQVIAGTGALTQAGSGDLTLSGVNTYTGATNLNAGTLVFSTLSNIGGGSAINFGGGTLKYASGTTTDISTRTITINSGGATIDTNGNNVTLANAIGNGGAGGLSKKGSGTLTLPVANTYGGNTAVAGGKLLVTNTSGSATSAGNVSVAAGGTLAGTGIVAGSVSTVTGAIIEPGDSGVGTLTLGGLSLASGSIMDMEFASTSSYDKVVTTGSNGLTVNGGGLRLYSAGSTSGYATAGTYNLVQYSGSVQGTGASALSVLNPQAGFSYSFGSSGGFLTLQIVQDAILSQWASTSGGSWATSGNWSNGVPSSGYTAQFTSTLGAPATVTLDGDRTVNGLVFNSSPGYTIASGTSGSLTIQKTGGAAVNALSGDHVISAPVVLGSDVGVTTQSGTSLTISGAVSGAGGIVKDGAGLLSLTGHNTFSGNVNVVNGVLGFSYADSLGSGTLTLNGGTLLFNTGNTADISAKTITFGLNGAAIDTNDNDVVFANSIGNSGTGIFSKTGAGSLTLMADSTYQGDTYLQGGELIIASNGALGNESSTLRLKGGTLVPLSTMTLAGTTARAVNLETTGGGVLVPSGLTLTVSGAMTGSGPLTKSGAGDLSITANNSTRTGATTIESGAVRLGNDRTIGQTGLGTGAITFSGNAALYLNGVGTTDNGTSFGVLSNAIVVPAGVTAEIRNPARGGYTGVLSGQAVTVDNVTSYQSGTVNLYVDGVRCETPGQWPNFTGQLNVYKTPTGAGTDTDVYYMTSAQALANAKVHFFTGVQVYQSYNPPSSSPFTTTHNFGELVVDSGAILSGNTVAGRFNAYSIGALNTDSVINGQVTGSIGAYGPAYPILTKVGTGRLTISNDHMTAGPVNVNAGVLDIRGSIASFYQTPGANGLYGTGDGNGADDGISLTQPTGDYVVVNPGAVTVAAAGTLAGNGTLGGAITVNGTLRTDSTGTLGGNLKLTGTASLTLAATSITQFDIGGAVFTGVKSSATGANTYGGALKFNFLGTVFTGSYKVFDLAVAPVGAFTGVSVTTTVDTETALTDSGSGVWTGIVGSQSYSFDASTGVLSVTGGGSAVTPGTSTLSATAGNAAVNLSWTAASGADTYTVKRATTAGGTYTNVIGGLAGTTYSDTTVTNGTTYYYVVQAKNTSSGLTGALSNEASATPTAVVYTGLQTWRHDQFGVYDDDNTVLAGDTEDYDGDGLANLLEYALGTDPKVPNASPVVVGKSGNNLTLTYPRRSPADVSLSYAVQGSSNLTTGFTAATGATNTVGSTSTYTDDVDVSAAGVRRFLRLSVSYTTAP